MSEQLPPTDHLSEPDEPFTIDLESTEPPRIWTVFLTYGAVFFASGVVQVLAILILFAGYLAQGGDAKRIQEKLPTLLTRPSTFIVLAGVAQFGILIVTLVATRLSPVPSRWRLGLVRPAMPTLAYPILAVGSMFPFAIGMALAIALTQLIAPDANIRQLYEHMTWGWAIPFVLFIALVPGIVEELLFRGYMQRRLLERWSPGLSIFVTSLLFAVLHIMPHTVVFAFVVGLWLGVLAWRTGSVWPGVVCHAFINGSWNIFQIGVQFSVFSDDPSPSSLIAVAAIVIACFGASVWLIARPTEPPARLA